MREAVERIQNEINEQQETLFSANVDLDVHLKYDSLKDYYELQNVPDTVEIKFHIEEEYRSWGIKDIEFSVEDISEFDIDIAHPDKQGEDAKSVTVKVDPGMIEIEWLEGQVYTPANLEVTIDKEGKAIDAVLVIYYLSK